MAETKKTCTKCKKEKLTVDFYTKTNRAGELKLEARCKSCRIADKKKSEIYVNSGDIKKYRSILRMFIEACECRDSKRLHRACMDAKDILKNQETEVAM